MSPPVHNDSVENNPAPKSLNVAGKKDRSTVQKTKEPIITAKTDNVPIDNVTNEQDPLLLINESMSDVQKMTDREILMATYRRMHKNLLLPSPL